MSRRNGDAFDTNLESEPPGDDLVAAIVTGDDGRPACTIYPQDVPDDILMTTWITAEEGWFVPLEDAR